MKIDGNVLQVGGIGSDLFVASDSRTASFGNRVPGFLVQEGSVRFWGLSRRPYYLEAPDSSSLDLPQNFTIQFWLRVDRLVPGVTTNEVIFNKENSYELGISPSGEIMIALFTDQGTWAWENSGYTVEEGYWNHITWTWDGTNHRLYVNGAFKKVFANSNPGTPVNTTYPFRIGARGTGTTGNASKIDFSIAEFRIWSKQRKNTNREFLGFDFLHPIDPTTTNLVAYWPLNGVGDYQDKTSNGNHLTLKSTATSSGSHPTPIIDGGAVYGGGYHDGTASTSSWDQVSPVSLHPVEGIQGDTVVGFWGSVDDAPTGDKRNGLNDPLVLNVSPDITDDWSRYYNGELDAYYWDGYNGGVASPTTGYFVHVDPAEGLFGGNSLVFPNENSIIHQKGRWLGVRQSTTSFFSNAGNLNGVEVTISMYVKVLAPGMKVAFGIYHSNPNSGQNDFEISAGDALYTSPPINEVGKWVRIEKTWTIDTAYFDTSAASTLYIYGEKGAEGRMWVSAPQIEFKGYARGFAVDEPSGAWSGYRMHYDLTDSLLGNVPLTVGMWVKKSKVTGDRYMFSADKLDASPFFGFWVFQNGGDIYFRTEAKNGTSRTCSTSPNQPLNDGEWHHVVAVLERGATEDTMRLYVDGVEVDTNTAPAGDVDPSVMYDNGAGNIFVGAGVGVNSDNALEGVMQDFFMGPYAASPSTVKEMYDRVAGRKDSQIAYDGGNDVLSAGVIEGYPPADFSTWTVFDPASGYMIGRFGRAPTSYNSEVIEALPYGPWGTSLWLGPVPNNGEAANGITRWQMSNFHGWHTGLNANDYVRAARNGEWFRLPVVNPNTNQTHTEFLTDQAVPIVFGEVITQRFLYRSDGDLEITSVSFYTDNGHHAVTPTNIDLGNGVKLLHASYTAQSGDNKARGVDIRGYNANGATYLEIAHPAMTAMYSYLRPFRWGMWNSDGTNLYSNNAGIIDFRAASEIIGQNRTGTIVIAFNPASHEPENYGRLIVVGRDSESGEDSLAIAYGANYNSGNRIDASVYRSGSYVAGATIDYNFQPWTWYFIVLRWGFGQLEMSLLDANGTYLDTAFSYYTDTDFPLFNSFSAYAYDNIRFGAKRAYNGSINAILGPVFFNQDKKTGKELDALLDRLIKGKLSIYDGGLYVPRLDIV